jgi:hypothetical protein
MGLQMGAVDSAIPNEPGILYADLLPMTFYDCPVSTFKNMDILALSHWVAFLLTSQRRYVPA